MPGDHLFPETLLGGAALYGMLLRSHEIVEDVKLQFARQLYQDCLERHGAEHEQTRKLRSYVADLERTSRPHKHSVPAEFSRSRLPSRM